MQGIDSKITYYKLTINPNVKPVQQKKRHHGQECSATIKVKVEKLLRAKFIEEVLHITWLANMVMVKKANGSWRIAWTSLI